MKKKVLSPEALQALKALNRKNEPAPEGAEVEKPEAEGSQTETPVVEGSQTEIPEGQGEGTTAPEASTDTREPDPRIAELEANLVEADNKTEALEAQVAELTANTEKLAAVEATAGEYREIVVSLTNNMRCALSLTEVDLSALADDQILREYSNTVKTFEKSLPVGGIVPDKQMEPAKEAVMSRADANNIKALGF